MKDTEYNNIEYKAIGKYLNSMNAEARVTIMEGDTSILDL